MDALRVYAVPANGAAVDVFPGLATMDPEKVSYITVGEIIEKVVEAFPDAFGLSKVRLTTSWHRVCDSPTESLQSVLMHSGINWDTATHENLFFLAHADRPPRSPPALESSSPTFSTILRATAHLAPLSSYPRFRQGTHPLMPRPSHSHIVVPVHPVHADRPFNAELELADHASSSRAQLQRLVASLLHSSNADSSLDHERDGADTEEDEMGERGASTWRIPGAPAAPIYQPHIGDFDVDEVRLRPLFFGAKFEHYSKA